MLSWLQQVRRCWLEMVSGQNIRRILLKFWVWKVDSLLRSLAVILQCSEAPYSRVESTQLWYSRSLVLVVYWDDFHTLLNILKAFLVFEEIPDVAACSAIIPDSVTEVGEFFGCWKIISVHFYRRRVWYIQNHHFCLLLADLQAYLLCKHGWLSLGCVDEYVRQALGHQRIPDLQGSRKGSNLMPRGRSDVVCRINQSIVRMKSNTDIGHLCLTPVFTSKLDSLFPTLHLKLL